MYEFGDISTNSSLCIFSSSSRRVQRSNRTQPPQSQSLQSQQPPPAGGHHYSPESMIYDQDPSAGTAPSHDQRLVAPLTSFEYQADFSSQLTEVASM